MIPHARPSYTCQAIPVPGYLSLSPRTLVWIGCKDLLFHGWHCFDELGEFLKEKKGETTNVIRTFGTAIHRRFMAF